MSDNLTGDMVAEFIRDFGASLDPRLWLELVKEETAELEEAIEGSDKAHILKEMTDLMYVQIGFNFMAVGPEQLNLYSDAEKGEAMSVLTKAAATYDSALEALGDLNYFEAFRRVHLSNMSKMGEDGLPIKSESGKIMKGPHYREPTFGDLI